MNRGLSLIEIMVVMAITIILVTIGMVSYRNFNQKRIVKSDAQALITALNFARNKALSGEKPGPCGTDALDGWKLKFTNPSLQEYQILPVCNHNEITGHGIDRTFHFDDDVQAAFLPVAARGCLFKVLAQGVSFLDETGTEIFVSEIEIRLDGFSGTYTYGISVSQSGEISDQDFL